MDQQPPDRIFSPDGASGWIAMSPEGYRVDNEEETCERPREGSLIRLMGEHEVDVPLWGEDGLIFNDGDELAREWGVSAALVADIVAWGIAWQTAAGQADHNAEGARLVLRLDREVDHRFRIVFKS